jgi:putative PIN family toxin of toxin-antitoxin system
MKNIILDTNVLVAGLRSALGTSHRLLTLIGSEQIQLHVSTPLIAEYDEILQRELPHVTFQEVVNYICQVAIKHKIFYLWRPLLKDPDDDFLLELAVKSQASIVTWNVKDFKAANKFGIQVITPKDLLIELGITP